MSNEIMTIDSNTISSIESPIWGSVRGFEDSDGKTWFVGKDIADKLGYVDPAQAISQHTKKSRKSTIKSNRLGTPPLNVLVIPESDVWRLVMRSNLPKAEEFQDWICEEVIPTLRKTGSVAINDVNMAVVKELGESTRQLAFVTNRLADTSRELGIMQYKYGLATAKLHVLTNLPAPKDVLVDPKKYSSASDVFANVAGYYMRKDNDKGDSIIKLGMLLYNTSVAKGYPIALSRREFVFHKDVVDECVAALKAKAGPRDIDLAFRPGARKKAGVSGLNMSSILMDVPDEEVEEAVDNPSDDDDLTFDI